MTSIERKVALVTGASQGIGAAVAAHLAKCGAHVVLVARSKDTIDANVNTIIAAGGVAEGVSCDVSDYAQVKDAVDFCVEKHGSIDIVVNNAGTIDPISRMTDSDPEVWSKAVDINYKGVYFSLRAALPHMEKQGSGTIVNLSSGAANSALEGWSHYCSTKAAAKKLTECAHKEMHEKGIRVVGLSPGTVMTDMMDKIKKSGINAVSQLDPSVHISPEWVARAVAFLCTPAADEFLGTDFSIKTEEGRKLVGLI